ncbi:hypothetical protein [Shouchella shacheensis]|uniref:hypothetical protein n=1 Tax=Shouchella shacheensis TaxID=1649580 RepID=UPI00073FBEFF|nr:hypothetical protein [Shouchella shacheensis]
MVATIKSPFIPLFLKQKVGVAYKRVGSLRAIKRVYQLKGHKSYQLEFKGETLKLIEGKKENKKRVWMIKSVSAGGAEKEAGRLTLMSTSKETLSNGYTEFRINYQDDEYYVKKPFMRKKNYCEMQSKDKETLAIHQEQSLFSFKREISVENPLSTSMIALAILTLSVIIFIA